MACGILDAMAAEDPREAHTHVGEPPGSASRNTELSLDGNLAFLPRYHLLVFVGTHSWMYQLPARGEVVIGRSQTADLRVDDASISRQHARIVVHGDALTIRDLGSQNGTFLNDRPVEGELAIEPGDTIRIHNATMILHAPAARAAPRAVIEAAAFRQRLEDEVDRAIRYQRAVSVIVLLWPRKVGDPRAIERMLAGHLRRIDCAAWESDRELHISLAEVSGDEARTVADRILAATGDDAPRAGRASWPDDGVDADALIATARNAADSAEPGKTASTPNTYQTRTFGGQRMIIADPAVVRLYALIERIAPVDLPILITGETGCGKELAATAVHAMSRRAARTLVSLNCAAIQETLVESELFGHEKGAFSGAVATKVGLIEAASGSTLFLDEIGELAPTTQAKLLRVLESKRMTRVGDVREREVDVRIVAATNRDLEDEVAVGRFRQDLYFRLSAATLHLPPLRERPRELPLLAAAFLDEACQRASRDTMTIRDDAMQALLAYGWPGNVRELKNVMQYVAAAYPAAELTAEHVAPRLGKSRGPRAVTSPEAAAGEALTFRPLAEEIRELEQRRIAEAIEAAGGNQTKAAGLLSMPVRTFFEKAKQYGLNPKKK